MNLDNTQIVALYDNDPKMTVQTLAQVLGYDVEAVKCILSATSKRYRSDESTSHLVFNADDRAFAASVMKELLIDPDCPHAIKAKVSAQILDRDEKGDDKRIVRMQKTAGTININILNQYIQAGRKRLKEMKGEPITV